MSRMLLTKKQVVPGELSKTNMVTGEAVNESKVQPSQGSAEDRNRSWPRPPPSVCPSCCAPGAVAAHAHTVGQLDTNTAILTLAQSTT